MKITLSSDRAVYILMGDEYASWTYQGAKSLVEYLEDLEKDLGEEIEMDVTAIRCDYHEYESAEDAATDRGWTEEDGDPLEWLHNRGTCIEVPNGHVVVSND